MTPVARLTWQVPDPRALAADLERRLGAGATVHASSSGGLVLRLGATDVDLVPWRAEAADDAPQPGGRLVYEPLYEEPAPGAAEAVGPADAANPGDLPLPAAAFALVGVAWATVELDRAESELGPWLEPRDPAARGDDEAAGQVEAGEPHLGARTRSRAASGLPGRLIVLAEPATEGRLAASLARDGEGPSALYLAAEGGLDAWRRAASARGVAVSGVRPGPLGPSVLVAGPPAGPHLIVVDGRGLAARPPARSRLASPDASSSRDRPRGTIAP